MSVTSTLKRVGRAPFHAIGLDVVRRKQRNPKVFPTWLERLQHAKELGFAPRVIFDGAPIEGIGLATSPDCSVGRSSC